MLHGEIEQVFRSFSASFPLCSAVRFGLSYNDKGTLFV